MVINLDPIVNPEDRRNPIQPWEHDYWTPEPLFAGKTVFCLASGPSLTQEIADQVKGRATIVVNSSYVLAPWADVLFWTDNGWYMQHRFVVMEWPGIAVTVSRMAKRELDDPRHKRKPRIMRLKMHGDPTAPKWPPGMPKIPGFPPVGSGLVKQGRNSGNTAVALAVAMGAKRIVLLGYDCQVVNGREHHHDHYAGSSRDLTIYEKEFQKAFDGWHAAGLNSGVEIINCTHGSAITEFPFARLEDVL